MAARTTTPSLPRTFDLLALQSSVRRPRLRAAALSLLTPATLAYVTCCTGHCKTIEFAFDTAEDTAECIANEMMEDLSLSAAEAQDIAAKIREEIARTVHERDGGQGQAPVFAPEPHCRISSAGGASPDTLHPPPGLDRASSPALLATSASVGSIQQAPTPPLPSRLSDSSAGRPPLPPAPPQQPSVLPQPSATGADARSSASGMANGRGKSGYHTPATEESGGGSLKGVSIHELIAAMRAAQEEVAQEQQPLQRTTSNTSNTQLHYNGAH